MTVAHQPPGPLRPLKPSQRERRLSRALRRVVIPFLFGATLLGGCAALIFFLAPELFFGLFSGNAVTPQARTREIAMATKRLDAAIAQAVAQVAPGTRVQRNREEIKTLNGVAWRSAHIELQLPPSVTVKLGAEALSSIPFDAKWQIHIDSFRLEPYSETLQVTVRGYPTHLITLHPTMSQVPPMDLSPDRAPRIAILIDDLGYEASILDPLWSLEAPFSVSILPFSPYALVLAETANLHTKEVLVHLPLEPIADPTRPSPRRPLGQITLSMSQSEIRQRSTRALRAIPYAVGVNNHEGSAFMRSASHLRTLLEVVKEERMFFVDSRTTAGSRGLLVARALELPATDRQVFLDNDPDPVQIGRALGRLKSTAARRGSALGIGHTYPTTVRVLAEWLSSVEKEGFVLVPVSVLAVLPPKGEPKEGGG